MSNHDKYASSRYGLGEIPPNVQYASPVSTFGRDPRAASLPLNLVALIVSYLDDIGDIARVTRTSRLLYYMTLPQLYQKVSLHSYSDIRYVNGRPEGFGGGSPFTMALNGLVTNSNAALVKDFRIWGEWKEVGVEDFAKGRVPDNTMMLNTLLRAATDRMTKLRSFVWQLDCKPLQTVYQGLSMHTTLTSLTLKFPTTRVPRPTVLVPAVPSLRFLKATDIDPLCYPDDISLLILHATKLEDLRLHFSPRMRRDAEPSLNMTTFFGRLEQAKKFLPVRHLAMQNFFGKNMQVLDAVLSPGTCRSITFIDTFGDLQHNNPLNVYVDDTWKNISPDLIMDFRRVRCNELTMQHVTLLSRATGMEQLYFINSKHFRTGDTPTGTLSALTPSEAQSPESDPEIQRLGRDYLHAITRSHGSTLTHLLLSDRWSLHQDDVADIVRFCPNLEQLGLAISDDNHVLVRLLLPFLSKMKVIRILPSIWLDNVMRTEPEEERIDGLSLDMGRAGADTLQWVGFGNNVYKIGKKYQSVNQQGELETRREVTVASFEDVKDIELFSMDVLNIDVDPVMPFKP